MIAEESEMIIGTIIGHGGRLSSSYLLAQWLGLLESLYLHGDTS